VRWRRREWVGGERLEKKGRQALYLSAARACHPPALPPGSGEWSPALPPLPALLLAFVTAVMRDNASCQWQSAVIGGAWQGRGKPVKAVLRGQRGSASAVAFRRCGGSRVYERLPNERGAFA